mgnify:CR=1 FL=1
MQDTNNIINQFLPISLAEMDRVKLMNRVDTKFAFRIGLLEELLHELKSEYKILEINTIRIPKYESLYFDDEEFSFFQAFLKDVPNCRSKSCLQGLAGLFHEVL